MTKFLLKFDGSKQSGFLFEDIYLFFAVAPSGQDGFESVEQARAIRSKFKVHGIVSTDFSTGRPVENRIQFAGEPCVIELTVPEHTRLLKDLRMPVAMLQNMSSESRSAAAEFVANADKVEEQKKAEIEVKGEKGNE